MEEKVPYITKTDDPSLPFEVIDRRTRGFYMIDNEFVLYYARLVTPLGVAVYNALQMFAGNRDIAWPSRQTIADMIGVSLPSVDKGLKLLAKHQIITVESRYNADGGQASSIYALLDKSWWVIVPTPVKNFDTPPVKNFDTNNTHIIYSSLQGEAEVNKISSLVPIGKEQDQVDQQTHARVSEEPTIAQVIEYYRVNIEGKRKVPDAKEEEIFHLCLTYGNGIVREAMKEAILNNKHKGQPGFNFIKVIAEGKRKLEEETNLRRKAIERSERGEPEPPPQYDLENDGLSEYRKAVLESMARDGITREKP